MESGQSESTITFRCALQNTIKDVLEGRGWKQGEDEMDWDLFWADTAWIRENLDHVHLDDFQRVNHFRNHYELTRKDHLVKNLKRAKRAYEKEGRMTEAARFDFFPATFVLPNEYALYVEEFKKPANAGALWIMKPIGKAQGRGIFLIHKLSQISEWKKDYRWKAEHPQAAETYIVQRYIANPYLIGGKKFDLRLYALVTSFAPLTLWIYRSGFARFTTSRFSGAVDDIDNSYIHLTNVAIQKTSDTYDASHGGKWDLTSLRLYLVSKHGHEAVEALFGRIQELIVASLQSVQKVMIADKHCFELYGYDVLIDADLKPWLIEVNASPSLSANTASDYAMKTRMLDDMLSVLDLEGVRTGNEDQVGGFDLVWSGGPVTWDRPCATSSYIGAANDRVPQLRRMIVNAKSNSDVNVNGLAASSVCASSRPSFGASGVDGDRGNPSGRAGSSGVNGTPGSKSSMSRSRSVGRLHSTHSRSKSSMTGSTRSLANAAVAQRMLGSSSRR